MSRAVPPSFVGSREYRCRMTTRSGHGEALGLKAERDRRLRAIDDFIAAHEAEHGEITDDEMEAAYRRAKARAIVVRGGRVINDKGP